MIEISDEEQRVLDENAEYYQLVRIPKRDDYFYFLIEDINDDELSHGTAYYMSTRHPEASVLLDRLTALSPSEEYDEIKSILLQKFGLNQKCISYYIEHIFPDKFLTSLYEKDAEDGIPHEEYELNSIYVTPSHLEEDGKIYSFDEIILEAEEDGYTMRALGLLMVEDLSITPYILKYLRLYYSRKKRYFSDTKRPYVITEKNEKIYLDTLKDTRWYQALDDDFQQMMNLSLLEITKPPKAKLALQIPMLTLPKMNIVSIDINLSLPLIELQAHIKRLKEAIDDIGIQSTIDYIIAPIEENGKDRLKNNTFKKNLADKFFVYDYVTAKLLLASNSEKEQLKSEYESNINDLDNTLYNDERKKELKKNLKVEYDNNLAEIKKYDAGVVELFKDEELLSQIGNKSASTARDYYYSIKPYIEEMKYKTLVTGNNR